jgi:hypothetical protein
MLVLGIVFVKWYLARTLHFYVDHPIKTPELFLRGCFIEGANEIERP